MQRKRRTARRRGARTHRACRGHGRRRADAHFGQPRVSIVVLVGLSDRLCIERVSLSLRGRAEAHRGSRDGDAVLKSLEQLINDAVGMTRTGQHQTGHKLLERR